MNEKEKSKLEKIKKIADVYFLNQFELDDFLNFMDVLVDIDPEIIEQMYQKSLEKEKESFKSVEEYIKSHKYFGISYE